MQLLPVAAGREERRGRRRRTSENTRNGQGKKVPVADSFINLTLNYLLHFTCVCARASSMPLRQRAEKTMH